MKSQKISVIITTKNEAHHIGACLESITRQIKADFEIIVVDNHSSDSTKQIARKYTRNIFDAGPERAAQRNFGAKNASGTYLVFLDADMILTPRVLSECVALCENRAFSGVVIPEKSFGIGFWAQCKALERAFYEHIDWIEAARFFRKDVFIRIGGYDETLTGPEDFELPQRIKMNNGDGVIGRINDYILHDEGNLSLAKDLKKKYYYGKKMRRYGSIPGSSPYFLRQANPLTRYALFFRKPMRLIVDPVHAAGMLLMKSLEMIAMALGSLHT